jgi:tRNA1Val (adenine37-N6)-methyltransferase
MGNSYFQFKQFRIEQDVAAMKVSTDACIQGAWTPVTSSIKRALDIGTGTGLLSLMLVQRNKDVVVDAIEIDLLAANQARENIDGSPWNDRVRVVEGDVRQHQFGEKYELIICNPPFFSNSLLGPSAERNTARHGVSLSLEELFTIIESNLSEEGYASVLLPVAEHGLWAALVETKGWKIFHQLNIIPRIGSAANRVVSLCSADMHKLELVEDLIIRNRKDEYTPEFVELLRPFYLRL